MKKILSLFICIILILSLCSCSYLEDLTPHKNYDGELIVHFIDVGQGDCTLIESDNQFMLIDAGEAEYGATVCQYLENNNVKTLSYVVATHPHSDHCGGLTEVINTFECENFITVETDQQTRSWLNVLNAVSENNVNYIDAKVNATYSLGDSTFEILGPHSSNYEEYNNFSVVIKATFQNNSFLFTGDAERLAEHEMLDYGSNLSADVLKIPHHGSSSSSSKEFLSAVSPTYGVISCGYQNEYGHPHKETVKSLNALGVTIYRTDILGTIVATSDGNNIEFFYENTDEKVEKPTPVSYIGNKNTKKFHLDSCNGVKDIKAENKVQFHSREDALEKGYSPCKTCNP
ncbi:MAG: MBL fold metallo-hydrolase [Ruminococcus sp.]|nr:MBL fold metallo-hydrolase [Ruminococcus sp.]